MPALKTGAPAPQPAPPDRLAYSVDEAADRLGVGRSTLYAWIEAGLIPSRKIGGRRLIPARPLDELLAGDALDVDETTTEVAR